MTPASEAPAGEGLLLKPRRITKGVRKECATTATTLAVESQEPDTKMAGFAGDTATDITSPLWSENVISDSPRSTSLPTADDKIGGANKRRNRRGDGERAAS